MKQLIMKYVGIGAVVVGTILLYLSGTGESQVIEIVAGVFVLVGLIYEIIKK